MRLRLCAMLLVACCLTPGDTGASVNSVVATVRTALRKKHKDGDVAAALGKQQLAERLEDRVLEILESEGAGPQTMGALQQMRDATRQLTPPLAPPPGMEPPPPPSGEQESRILHLAGSQSVAYTQSLPDFICTETIHRWTAPGAGEAWKTAPTIVADLTFFDLREHYKVLSVDGQPSSASIFSVGGAISQGEFGSMLGKIFDTASQTNFRWDHWTTLRKQPAHVYYFRISRAHAPHLLVYGATGQSGVTAIAGQRGYLYIDRDNRVLRIAEEAEDIPAGFPIRSSSTVLDYDYAEIASHRYLLPLRAETRMEAGPVQNLHAAEFRSYRKFSADTSMRFGDTVEDPPTTGGGR